MYDPVKDGVQKSAVGVSYVEAAPPTGLAELVHCYWELKSDVLLPETFTLHALPDACVNVLFDQQNTSVAGVTALHTTHTTLDLGRSFHYVGVQFFPGVWTGVPDGTVDHYVGAPYCGDLPLVATNRMMASLDFDAKQPVLSALVADLVGAGVVRRNALTAAILTNIDEIHSVEDMARVVGLSARQLQRNLKATTGFAPHDLLKVLRLQHSFRSDYLLAFSDQAHFTHEFRKITGHTPGVFRKMFDV